MGTTVIFKFKSIEPINILQEKEIDDEEFAEDGRHCRTV